MWNFIKNKEPVAVAAFVIALAQGLFVVASQFGHSLTAGQSSSITALLTVVTGFFVRGNVTSNAGLEAKPAGTPTTPPTAGLGAIVLMLVALLGCSPRSPGCTPESERAAVGARYEAELAIACPDHTKPLSECAGFRDVHARYLQAREEWVECSKK